MMQERGIRENPMSHAEIGRKVLSLASTVVASLQAVMILALANSLFVADSVVSLNVRITDAVVSEFA